MSDSIFGWIGSYEGAVPVDTRCQSSRYLAGILVPYKIELFEYEEDENPPE